MWECQNIKQIQKHRPQRLNEEEEQNTQIKYKNRILPAGSKSLFGNDKHLFLTYLSKLEVEPHSQSQWNQEKPVGQLSCLKSALCDFMQRSHYAEVRRPHRSQSNDKGSSWVCSHSPLAGRLLNTEWFLPLADCSFIELVYVQYISTFSVVCKQNQMQ